MPVVRVVMAPVLVATQVQVQGRLQLLQTRSLLPTRPRARLPWVCACKSCSNWRAHRCRLHCRSRHHVACLTRKDASLAFPAATCIAAAAASAARDTLSSCAMSDHEGTLDVTHSTLCFLNSERAAVQRCCTRRNDANNNEGAGTGLTTRCARPPSSSGTSCCHSQPTGSSSSPLAEGPPACPPSVEKQARRERQSSLSHGRRHNITHTHRQPARRARTTT